MSTYIHIYMKICVVYICMHVYNFFILVYATVLSLGDREMK